MIRDVQCIIDYQDARDSQNAQKNQEEIDIDLLKNLSNLIETKNILRPDDAFVTAIDRFIASLPNLEKEVRKMELSILSDDSNNKYRDMIRVREKQQSVFLLMNQLFKSLKPQKLAKSYTALISMLKEFQEISFEYHKDFRDHLIHSFRVFLLISSLIKKMDDSWISVLRASLSKSLELLNSDIIPEEFMRSVSDRALWRFSIEGASVMGLFHDIGLAYSEYHEIIKGLNERIFPKDRSLYSIEPPVYKVKKGWKTKKKEMIDHYQEVIERMHPKFKGILSELRKELDRIIAFKGALKRNRPSHGAISFFNVYTIETIKKDLLRVDYADIQKKLIETSRIVKGSSMLSFARQKRLEDSDKSEALQSIGESCTEGIPDQSREEAISKVEDIFNTLISCEAFSSILIHDMGKFAFLSPFSEILVFADVCQEWDRVEYEKGELKEHAREEIKICVESIKESCKKIGPQILSFYEKGAFRDSNFLNKLSRKCLESYTHGVETGRFRYYFYFCATDDQNIDFPSQAVFICPFLSKKNRKMQLSTVKSIRIEDFCSNCTAGRKRL